MKCTNNLKQIGGAIHNYYTAYDSLPCNVVKGGKGPEYPAGRYVPI